MSARRPSILILAFVIAGVATMEGQQPSSSDTAMLAVVEASNQFDFELYRSVSGSDTGKNVFFSPYSISTALSMVFEGSRNETRKQMGSVLHLNLSDADRRSGFADLLAKTKAAAGNPYKLELANALWGERGYHFESSFTADLSRYYGGGFNAVDFVGAKEATIHRINTWAEEKTNNKIGNLIHNGDVSPLTRLILTNAIYFKGSWEVPFKREATHDGVFHITRSNAVNVPMMRHSGHYRYTRENGIAAIELPYAGDELSMIALLPDGDAAQLGQKLTLADFKSIRSHMGSREVDVTLPRFKFESRYLLNQKLAEMGMPDAFNQETADFSGITGKKDLHLSQVIHQAMIEVNEEGSEAAAATAIVVATRAVALPSMREVFNADHPFLFAIVHNSTGCILFMGSVSDPAS